MSVLIYIASMRLDHIAYRVKSRHKTAEFFGACFGYVIGTEFQIKFDDGGGADCLALVPPEVRHPETNMWKYHALVGLNYAAPGDPVHSVKCEYHASPEIFVSDGPAGSIVGDWVNDRAGVGGVHHIAYQVSNVEEEMEVWKEKGYAEFLSNEPLECPGLRQVFTKPSELTGVIYELIERDGDGFCEANVRGLMESTKEM